MCPRKLNTRSSKSAASQPRIDYAALTATVSLLFACAARPASADFDWGSGCAGGNGSFAVNLTRGKIKSLGLIPTGKWNVEVRLSAAADVDIQLYDQDDNSSYSEGAAVVAWCDRDADKKCNLGVLGSDAGLSSSAYRDMAHVEYSGYDGVGGQPGKEYIKIEGVTSQNLAMKAFAYQAGEAKVFYKFDRVQTGCCMGVTACTGASFLAQAWHQNVSYASSNFLQSVTVFGVDLAC